MLNPESLLLPSLRVAAPLPAALGQAAAPAPPIGGVVADAASAALLMAGLTAEDLAEWDDWGEDWGPPAPAGGVASRAAHAPAPEQQLEVQWDEPELPDAAISFTTPSNTAAAPPVRAEPLGVEVQLCFDDNSDDGGGCHEEAEGGQLTANGPPQDQPGWQPARPEVEHSAWQQQLSLAGWDPGSHERQQRELEWGLDDDLWSQLDGTAASPTAACAHGSRVAPAADPWAALQPQGHDSSAGAGASRSAVTHARRRGRLRPTADSPASAMSLSSSAALSFAIDTDSGVAASAADGEETGVGGCWGCDMEWDECAAFDAAERQSVPAHCPSVLAAEGARQPATAVAAAQPGQFDWEFDDGEAVAAGAVVSMGPTKPALLEGTAPALARAQAGKRRHADIGAEIIQARLVRRRAARGTAARCSPAAALPVQALLEERRRAHVDLQPLLQQLTQRMAAAFASGGGPVLLSSLRQECLDSGAAGTQGSTKVRCWARMARRQLTSHLLRGLLPSNVCLLEPLAGALPAALSDGPADGCQPAQCCECWLWRGGGTAGQRRGHGWAAGGGAGRATSAPERAARRRRRDRCRRVSRQAGRTLSQSQLVTHHSCNVQRRERCPPPPRASHGAPRPTAHSSTTPGSGVPPSIASSASFFQRVQPSIAAPLLPGAWARAATSPSSWARAAEPALTACTRAG